ncbi:TetR family transcriptional regulator C-terminal domain-containing protein [Roseovarius aestuarii]|nr:TetR family transcriptional regulator C-terminal domain-containing protein [Roseovarius aestuarii]
MSNPESAPRYRRYTRGQRRAMLIDAGMRCLAQGGITHFTVDNVIKEAGVSRGLITHHFQSMDSLLEAIYSTLYEGMFAQLIPAGAEPPTLAAMIDAVFDEKLFTRANLTLWLSFWGEIATNPKLRDAHRHHYKKYRDLLAQAVANAAKSQSRDVDAQTLAIMLISLIDGLWLEQSMDDGLMSAEAAKSMCRKMLAAHLGDID